MASGKVTYLYFLHTQLNDDDCAFKIGITQNIEDRINALQIGNPVEIKLHHREAFPSIREASNFERIIHRCFSSHHMRGEWFKCDGYINDAINYIKHNGIISSIDVIQSASNCYKELNDNSKFEGIDFETQTAIYGDGGFHLSCWSYAVS